MDTKWSQGRWAWGSCGRMADMPKKSQITFCTWSLHHPLCIKNFGRVLPRGFVADLNNSLEYSLLSSHRTSQIPAHVQKQKPFGLRLVSSAIVTQKPAQSSGSSRLLLAPVLLCAFAYLAIHRICELLVEKSGILTFKFSKIGDLLQVAQFLTTSFN